MRNLDPIFLKNALQKTSFNIGEKDMQSTKYKSEIRYLYMQHMFPKFPERLFVSQVNKNSLNRAINALKSENNAQFQNLLKFQPGGLGPGEVLMYFLIDGASLGGAGSAGVDLVVGSKKYEIKAAVIKADGSEAYGYKTGGTFNIADLMVRFSDLKRKAGGTGSMTEIGVKDIALIKSKGHEAEYQKLNEDYGKRAYDNYFKNHEIMFIRNNPGANIGTVEALMTPKMNQISIERMTSGTIKPTVFLKR